MRRRRRSLLLLAVSAAACSRHPLPLADAPRPGIIDKPYYRPDDNSTTERMSYHTKASEAEVRYAFEQYCLERDMRLDPRPSGGAITWYKSDHDFLGILVSGTAVTYFYDK